MKSWAIITMQDYPNLYRTILGREPEAGAVDGLVTRLANGSSLAREREIMSNSQEARERGSRQ